MVSSELSEAGGSAGPLSAQINWQGVRATIPQPSGSKPGALPIELTPCLAAGEGFEPPYTDPKSAVLPLNDPASCDFYITFLRFVS